MPPLRLQTDAADGGAARVLPGAAGLAGCLAAAAILWLAVFPRIGAMPGVRQTIQRNESLGIDPSAKFYSELPAMPRIVEQVRDARRREEPATVRRLRPPPLSTGERPGSKL